MSKPRATALDRSMSGYHTSWRRVAVVAVLIALGIAWLAIYTNYAMDHALWSKDLGTAEPSNPLPWMAKLKMWNYLIGFGLIFAGLWISADKSTPAGRGRGVVIGMVGCLLVGLVWIVVFYLAGGNGNIPVMNQLGQWNLGLGMALVATAFAFATKWE